MLMGVAEQLMRRRRDSRWGDGPACASLQLHSPGDGAGSAPAGSSDGCGASRAQGGAQTLLLLATSPGLAVFFSSHVGGESHEHPPSWAQGMGHLEW